MTNEDYGKALRADGLFSPVPNRSYRPKNDDALRSVQAFLGVAGERVEKTCWVETTDENVCRAYALVHAETGARAVLTINYGGAQGYHAKLIVKSKDGQQQVAADNLESAMRKVNRFLDDPREGVAKKKGTTRRARRESGSFDVHTGTMNMRKQHEIADDDVGALIDEEDF